jgi:hypothetical protein
LRSFTIDVGREFVTGATMLSAFTPPDAGLNSMSREMALGGEVIMRVSERQPARSRGNYYCVDCGIPVTFQAQRCKKHYLKTKLVVNTSLNAVERRLKSMPKDLQAIVLRIASRYEMKSVFTKRAILLEAIEVVQAAVRCQGRCCAGKSLSERLEGL